jgi:hypothetical protein
MIKHGFIDESGTLADQGVMTVALVLLNGARTAEKLHPKLTKSIYPTHSARGLKQMEQFYASQELHFAQMNDKQKLAIADVLSKSNITAFVGFCQHTEDSTEHNHRFLMYRELLKLTINKAFETTDELIVSIAKQGGWESYGGELISELRYLPQAFTRTGQFRKGEFFLSSPLKQGLQIADFYASSSWHFLRAGQNTAQCAAYERIRHQVAHFGELTLKEFTKGK